MLLDQIRDTIDFSNAGNMIRQLGIIYRVIINLLTYHPGTYFLLRQQMFEVLPNLLLESQRLSGSVLPVRENEAAFFIRNVDQIEHQSLKLQFMSWSKHSINILTLLLLTSGHIKEVILHSCPEVGIDAGEESQGHAIYSIYVWRRV